MANNKKKNIQLGIDLQVQNYDAAIKALEAIEKLGGNTGKVASKLRQELLETKNAIIALGSTTTPQELKKFIKINGDLSDSLIDLGKEFKVTKEQVNKIKQEYADASAAVLEYTKKLEEAKKKEKELKKVQLQKADLAVKKLDEPGNEALKEKVKKRSSNQGKLGRINELKRNKDPDAERFLAELNLEHSKQKQILTEVQKEIKDYEDKLDKATKAVEKHEASLKSLKTQHGVYQSVRQSAEEAAESINENNEALIRTRDAAVKAGEGQIQVKKSTDEAANSFTRAARSVFNYTILYQGFKKILRESIRTIKEMDDAITGMTVVTNLSREQA
jgi:chromosome segregation ATPase